MSEYQVKNNLITEIHNLLDSPSESLEPALRRSVRLAELCNKEEFRLLFEIHIDGVKIGDESIRVRRWKDQNITPKWNPIDSFYSDRKVKDGTTMPYSIQKIENNLKSIVDIKHQAILDKEHKSIQEIVAVEADYLDVLARIKNRISFFLRDIESEIYNEKKFLTEVGKAMTNYAEKEYKVLKTIYDLSDGQPEQWIILDDLERKLGMSQSEVNPVIIELEERKKLIGGVEHAVWMLPAGIEEIEKTKKHPEQKTENFPANIYNTTIYGSVGGLSQGQNNTQNITQHINADFTKAISDLMTLIDNSSLSPIQKINVKSDVQTVKDLADLEKDTEVKELANSKIEAIKDVLATTADMTSLGMVLIPILQQVFR